MMRIEQFSDCKVHTYEGGFSLTVTGYNLKGNEVTVKIKCSRWDTIQLSDAVRKVIDFEQSEINRINDLCGFKQIGE